MPRGVSIAVAGVASWVASCSPPSTPPPVGDPRIVWTAPVPNSVLTPSADDSLVFFGDLDHGFFAVRRSTGTLAWSSMATHESGGPGFAAASNSVVAGPVVAIADGYVFGFDRVTGQRRWRFLPVICFSGNVATDGTTVYSGCGDGRVFAVNATTGAKVWETRVADDTGGYARDPIFYKDTLFVGFLRRTAPRTGGFGAIDAKTGALLWYTEFPKLTSSHPSAGHGSAAIVNDVVVAASDDGQVRALERATGAIRWVAPPVPQSAQGVGDDRLLAAVGQVIVAGSLMEVVKGYDAATGVERWTRTWFGSATRGLTADSQLVFLLDGTGALNALDPADGKTVWTFGGFTRSRFGGLFGTPRVVDGVVYVGGEKASYALKAKE